MVLLVGANTRAKGEVPSPSCEATAQMLFSLSLAHIFLTLYFQNLSEEELQSSESFHNTKNYLALGRWCCLITCLLLSHPPTWHVHFSLAKAQIQCSPGAGAPSVATEEDVYGVSVPRHGGERHFLFSRCIPVSLRSTKFLRASILKLFSLLA